MQAAQTAKQKFASDAAAKKAQFKLDKQQKKYDNKLAMQEHKQQLAMQQMQAKHQGKMDGAVNKIEMKNQAATNAMQQKELAKKAALKQQKVDNKLNAAQLKADNAAAWEKQKGSIQNENRTKFNEKTMQGLSFDQKRQYYSAIKREDKRAIKLTKAGIDPKTGERIAPTVLGPGQSAVLHNGQPFPGAGGYGTGAPMTGWQQAQNAMGTVANGVGNGLDRVMQLGMMSQMFGGMFGGGSNDGGGESAPSNVPSQQPATGMTPAPDANETTTSPSHVAPGGLNININSSKNNIWSGSQIGSNSSSSNTQAGAGIPSLYPNKKPSDSSTTDNKAPSQTGPSFSGWLV